MSVSPVANSSFLHGDRKPSPTSEKIIYATIDSLALKRATLPLQLLPVDDNDFATGTRNALRKKREIGSGTAIRKSGFKVDTTNPSSMQDAKYLLVVPSGKSEPREIGSTVTGGYSGTIAEQQDGEKDTVCLSSTVIASDNGDIDAPSIGLASEIGTKPDTVFANRGHANEPPSDDYEKIESVPTVAACRIVRKQVCEDGEGLCAKKTFVKSKSTNDLTTKSTSDRSDETKPLAGALSEIKLACRVTFTDANFACDKKKKHFARNVLHFVPEYLTKGPKRREKAKDRPNGSSSSLKTSSMDPMGESNFEARYRSRSLSREELKRLKISSPTNFVHVASATNPNLVSSENTLDVITHEEKCATLPLLVARNDYTERSSDVAAGGTAPDASSDADRNNAFDVAKLTRELLSELRARSEKAVESCQQAKTSKHPEPAQSLSPDELRANYSFLWSDRSKGFVGNARFEISRPAPNENRVEDIQDTQEEYDDVGPLNLEDDYDDVGVGTSMIRSDGNPVNEFSAAFEDLDSIYDDVMGPSDARHVSIVNKDSEIRKDASGQEENDYTLLSDEYSNVDEKRDDTEENDEDVGVYDDVGLPREERINSLYAGSTTGPTLESEWEDFEDSSAVSVPPLSTTETQVFASRKKSGQRWSRKMRRPRPKVSKRNPRCSSKPAARDSTYHVSVSLGRGSALLVGSAEEELEERKKEREDRTVHESSQRTQGLVQMRLIDLDEDVDTQETSCYVHEDSTSDDSTYESFDSLHLDEFGIASETETVDETVHRDGYKNAETEQTIPNRLVIAYSEAPTKPNPPPPREGSLTRTLGRRIKMLRRTWSITKGSLGRMRRRTSVQEDHLCEENKESSNDRPNSDGGRYFGFARHFKKTVAGPFSTFYLNGYTAYGDKESAEDHRYTAARTYSNTNEEADHYSVLADQEPLYQFYAEAAARVAFDSNSDGYEEVESTIPSRSTTDLARPGHRTLWCQTPQVINNGLLQRLSTEEKRVQEAKFEILTSEASYLNSLRVLSNEFLNESSIDAILSQTEKDKLFAGIPSVLHASEQFLAEMETLWRRDTMLHHLPDLLLKYSDKCLEIYVPYCSNQVSIDTALKDLRTRKGPKFEETISRIEARETCQSLSLHSFLMLPMQRITRLPLLADAVLSKLPAECAEKSEWERVLASLSYVVTECNEAARVAAKEIEMENLARKLEYSMKVKPIVLRGKHLVKSGPVVQLSTKADVEYKLTFGKRFNKTPLYLLLLTDYLLVAKYKANTQDDTYTVIDTCKRSLIALESLPEDSPFAGRNAMILTLLENYTEHQVEYILTCESDTERQRWLEAVSPSKRGLAEETLYEVWDCPQVVALYCYTPNQPDELSLHPGDVINVLRKMSDGWYHGEKLLNGEQGWFPGNYTKEVASEHVRAKNLKQRHRFLALSANPLQRGAKQQAAIH